MKTINKYSQGKRMLGYNLRDVVSIEANHTERYVILNLKFLSYQLFVDDEYKLKELIVKLQSFLEENKEKQAPNVDLPKFYRDSSKQTP